MGNSHIIYASLVALMESIVVVLAYYIHYLNNNPLSSGLKLAVVVVEDVVVVVTLLAKRRCARTAWVPVHVGRWRVLPPPTRPLVVRTRPR